jgi:hypothetical protein
VSWWEGVVGVIILVLGIAVGIRLGYLLEEREILGLSTACSIECDLKKTKDKRKIFEQCKQNCTKDEYSYRQMESCNKYCLDSNLKSIELEYSYCVIESCQEVPDER